MVRFCLAFGPSRQNRQRFFRGKQIVNTDEIEQKPAGSVAADQSDHRITDEAIEKVLADPSPAKRSGAGLSALALLLATLALAISAAGWMWWQSEQAQQQQTALWQTQQEYYQDELKRLESSVAALKDSSSQQSSALTVDLQQRLQTLESRQSADEDFRSETLAWSRAAQAALEDSQSRLSAMDDKLRNLSARSAQSTTELELEEIDYLLRMAQERLELFGDTRSADRALQLADQQVVAFANPMFIALRREIAAARQALAAADVPDMIALGAEFDKLQDGLPNLAFGSSKAESSPVDESVAAELPWWQRLKNALSGLVTVRRLNDAEWAMPVLADQLALRQRAWLQVEQARLAALSREQDLYQEALAQTQTTIGRWFAADDPEVKLSLSSLQSLQQRNVDPPMPNISGPWNTLRSIRAAGLPVAPQAAPQAAAKEDSEPATEVPATESAPMESAEPEPDSQQDDPAGIVIPADRENSAESGQ